MYMTVSPVVELRKKQWGTTPMRRDFDAVYYMGSTTAVGENLPVPPVIQALSVTQFLSLSKLMSVIVSFFVNNFSFC